MHDAGAGAVADGGDQANGFVFDTATAPALQATLARAIDCYREPQRWAALMQRGMALDHSWAGPAKQYVALYEAMGSAHGA